MDADAFVALAKGDDAIHEKAKRVLIRLLREHVVFLASNYVFAEAVTVLSKRAGKSIASAFIKAMKEETSTIEWIWVDRALERTAIDVFEEQTSKNVSFVDCTNIALARREGVDAVFSFDAVYRKNNIRIAEDFLE